MKKPHPIVFVPVIAALAVGGFSLAARSADEAPTDHCQAGAAVAQLPTGPTKSPKGAKTYIISPKDGETVPKTFTVLFGLKGMGVAPAAVYLSDEAPTGHHHLIVDADVEWTEPIGTEEGRLIHMGQAQTEWVLEGLSPGEHRLIAVVADGVHIPLDPPVSDTIWIKIEDGT